MLRTILSGFTSEMNLIDGGALPLHNLFCGVEHIGSTLDSLNESIGNVKGNLEKRASALTRWMAKISPAFKKTLHEKRPPEVMKQLKANAISMFKGKNPNYKFTKEKGGVYIPDEKLIKVQETNLGKWRHPFNTKAAKVYLHEKGHYLNHLIGRYSSGGNEFKAWDKALTLARGNPELERVIMTNAVDGVYGPIRGKMANQIMKEIKQFHKDKIKTTTLTWRGVKALESILKKQNPNARERLIISRYKQDSKRMKEFKRAFLEKMEKKSSQTRNVND